MFYVYVCTVTLCRTEDTVNFSSPSGRMQRVPRMWGQLSLCGLNGFPSSSTSSLLSTSRTHRFPRHMVLSTLMIKVDAERALGAAVSTGTTHSSVSRFCKTCMTRCKSQPKRHPYSKKTVREAKKKAVPRAHSYKELIRSSNEGTDSNTSLDPNSLLTARTLAILSATKYIGSCG